LPRVRRSIALAARSGLLRVRRSIALAALLALLLSASAQAARLETWAVKSRWVDPREIKLNPPADRVRALRVNVLLPDGYDGRRRFPVLYLLNGHGGSYQSWADPAGGDVARIARRLRAIIVIPEGASGWYANWWNRGARGAPAWERFYLEDLIPLVERRLRIRPGRRWRAIGGLSMGGEGAALLAAEKPGYFGSLASFSGPLSIQRPEWPAAFDTQGERHVDVFGDPVAQRFYWSGHNPTALVRNLRYTRTFVAVGDGSTTRPDELGNGFGAAAEVVLARQAEDFVTAARKAAVAVTFRPQQGIHVWRYWRRHLRQAIDWGLFRPVAGAPPRWSYRTVARRGEMWGLRYSFVKPPGEVVTFRREGSTLSATGSGRVRIRGAGLKGFQATLPFKRGLKARRGG
jgi:S-formylglutathione hydrolase FrmB